MNITSERAREACESCRKSHKKCIYDDNSMRCARCEKRNTPCSLFPSADTTAVVQPGLPTLQTEGSAFESWAGLGTPHGSSASSNFSYQLSAQEGSYWVSTAFTGDAQGYPVDMIYQSTADQHRNEQPAIHQGGLYGHDDVFGAHDST